MTEESAGDTALFRAAVYAELDLYPLSDEQRLQLGGSALDLLARMRFIHADRAADKSPDDPEEMDRKIFSAIGAAVFLHPDYDAIPAELRGKTAYFVFPEGDRRDPKRVTNIDGLTGMPNYDAFKQAKPRAESSPNVFFGILDGFNLGLINDNISHQAGSAVLIAQASCIIQAAKHHDVRRYFRKSGDEFIMLGSRDNISAALVAADTLFKARIDNGTSFVDEYQTEFPLQLYSKIELGFHTGIGFTFDEADEIIRQRKAAYRAVHGTKYDNRKINLTL